MMTSSQWRMQYERKALHVTTEALLVLIALCDDHFKKIKKALPQTRQHDWVPKLLPARL